MLSTDEQLRELEGQIGVLPWSGTLPERTAILAVKSWLVLKGIPKQKTDNSNWESLAKCYAIKNYFNVVAGNRPRNPNYKADRAINRSLLEGDDQEAAPPPSYNTDYNYDAIKEEPAQTQGLTALDIAQIMSQIEDKLENKFSHSLDRIVDNKVQTQIRPHVASITADLINQFNLGKIKVGFSDQAKSDLKSLVLRTAQDFLAQNLPPKETIINIPQKNINVNVGHVHHEFPTLLQALSCKLHVMLVGMASSSKTTSASMAAKALDIPFYHMGAAASEFKYAGFEDGHGKYHSTPFRMAFENGGLILLDEYDAGIPAAQMFVQAALANYTCHFPDKIVEAHPDFMCIAACNTYGRGSDRQYTSRNQQDAAALDRFVVLDWDIDEDLEAQLFGDGMKHYNPNVTITKTPIINGTNTMSSGEWVRHVQKIRHAINDLGERHLVTMRASDFGARLLSSGMTLSKVEQMCIWKGLNPATIEKIQHAAGLTQN
jgi:hypothetical protein